jgi:hypothetical protein
MITRRETLSAALLPLLPREDRIRAEFAAGEVVVVDGWLLARSEAEAPIWTR